MLCGLFQGDQASIIGGAINFVKELEQQVHLLSAKQSEHLQQGSSSAPLPHPFSDCFTAPQYSSGPAISPKEKLPAIIGDAPAAGALMQPNEVADIEVMLVESHANMKIRSKRKPKQLLRLISDLQALRLTVLHLNISTVGQFVLYSLSLKVAHLFSLFSFIFFFFFFKLIMTSIATNQIIHQYSPV